MTYLTTYLATAVVFLGLDAAWLGVVAGPFYRSVIGDLLLERFEPLPALVFYIIYVAGILSLAVRPAIASGRWATAPFHGARFGLFAYATYDLTNQATLKQWSTALTILDVGWGMVATAIAATAGYWVSSRAVLRTAR